MPYLLAIPIILPCERSWIKQEWAWKMTEQWRVLVRVLTEIRLNLKLGTNNTLCNTKEKDKWTVPTWVTKTVRPIGSVTLELEIGVKEVKNWSEQQTWWVAHVSKIHEEETHKGEEEEVKVIPLKLETEGEETSVEEDELDKEGVR